MVGGEVSVVRPIGKYVEIQVAGTGSERYDRCAIRVERTEHSIQPGDQVWWQGNTAYWTPAARRGQLVEEVDGVLVGSGTVYDIRIPRVSCSYIPKP